MNSQTQTGDSLSSADVHFLFLFNNAVNSWGQLTSCSMNMTANLHLCYSIGRPIGMHSFECPSEWTNQENHQVFLPLQCSWHKPTFTGKWRTIHKLRPFWTSALMSAKTMASGAAIWLMPSSCKVGGLRQTATMSQRCCRCRCWHKRVSRALLCPAADLYNIV